MLQNVLSHLNIDSVEEGKVMVEVMYRRAQKANKLVDIVGNQAYVLQELFDQLSSSDNVNICRWEGLKTIVGGMDAHLREVYEILIDIHWEPKPEEREGSETTDVETSED